MRRGHCSNGRSLEVPSEAFLLSTSVVVLAGGGDETQIATVALAARHADVVQMALGSTFGMMLANAPAVSVGDTIAHMVSVKLVHGIAAANSAAPGVPTLLDVGVLF